MKRSRGVVHLVGAGPGDPGLITVRGMRLLKKADVIVHDRLVARELLALARVDAEIVNAGKAPGAHTLTQEGINKLLVERAGRGLRVVRLKGGDPFVFGRGFEEWLACREAGVRCEIVSGVSSAVAAPAAAGIPVTHRGASRGFAVVTARTGESDGPVDLDFAALARMDTVVVMMGRAGLRAAAAGLIAAGRSASTPAACIERGTTDEQLVVRGELGDIAAQADEAELAAPMVLVVGEVAGLGGESSERKGELAGRTIVVTQAAESDSRVAGMLRRRGATVVECPVVRIELVEPCPEVEAAMALAGAYEWLAFTSQHGARAFAAAVDRAGIDGRAFARAKIGAVGRRTAEVLRKRTGLRADVVPGVQTAEGLLRVVDSDLSGKRVLWPRGDCARGGFVDELRRRGAEVDAPVVYCNRPREVERGLKERIDRGVDGVTFSSPSAVRSVVGQAIRVGEAVAICIGPTTAGAAREAGFANVVEAAEHSGEGLAAAAVGYFQKAGVCI